ncbi:unnamed protein product [Sphacelaria rigidula]
MSGRLTTRGPKEASRLPKQWEDNLQENLRSLGADAYDWVIAAKNVGKWYIGVEKGAEEFEDT